MFHMEGKAAGVDPTLFVCKCDSEASTSWRKRVRKKGRKMSAWPSATFPFLLESQIGVSTVHSLFVDIRE